MAKSEHKKVQSEDDIIKGKVYDYKRVLVGVDDSPDAQLAYQYAVKQAKEDKSELVIVSILEEQDLFQNFAFYHAFFFQALLFAQTNR